MRDCGTRPLVAAAVLLAGLLAPTMSASAQTVEDIEARDQAIVGLEALLNLYRCGLDIHTELVPGGCVNGWPAQPPAQPEPFIGTPTAEDIRVRDQGIAERENLLNTYRCLFGAAPHLVADGCLDPGGDDDTTGDDTTDDDTGDDTGDTPATTPAPATTPKPTTTPSSLPGLRRWRKHHPVCRREQVGQYGGG